MFSDHTSPGPLPGGVLRRSTADFVQSGTELLREIERIGNHAGCQPADWSWTTPYSSTTKIPTPGPTLRGHIYTRHPAAARQAIQQWANVLGLTPSEKAHPGTLSYSGEIERLPIEIWTVVDDKAFGHRKHAMLKLYAPDWILTALFTIAATTAAITLKRHRALTKPSLADPRLAPARTSGRGERARRGRRPGNAPVAGEPTHPTPAPPPTASRR
ncbi:hypothetical protein [Amycolatopsis sp. cmx-4-54]|uniref:hypothetical protein n=1 Tax=Amycolatopsis sp. cmx-4-54 TaxID=2790936 RepID=UPI003978257F